MKILRTPESRFSNLSDYPFEPNYIDFDHGYGKLRMHYLDEGDKSAQPVLLMHGEPSWSYLYRKMIPLLVDAGFRVIAPDHIGFGKSDKLPLVTDYSYQGHVQRLRSLIETLDLQNIISMGQDWGGPITLRQAAAMPERFAAIVVANTLLPNCEAPPRGIADWPGDGILQWIKMNEDMADLPVGDIMQGVCEAELSPEEVAAYNAPFPDATFKAGVRAFPMLIPIHDDLPGAAENRKAWEVLEAWNKPCLVLFGDKDPSTAPWREVFLNRIPGTKDFEHPIITGGGHMIQEDAPNELAAQIIKQLL